MQDDFTKTGDDMENMLIELIAVLENQAEHYRSLLNILMNEKKAVVSAKLDAVNAARTQKEAILSLIQTGDEKRKEVVEKISDHLGCPLQDLTLTQLAQRVEAPFSLKLIQCAADIYSQVQDIQHENEMNKSLITHSLKLIRSSINLIVQLVTPPPVYFRTGKMYQGEVCGTVLSSCV
jgi:flagellar biosynthesis/type III secretory pathway chaperone